MEPDAPAVFKGGNVQAGQAAGRRRPRRRLQGSRAHRRRRPTTTHVITHVCLETHGCVCEWEGDKLTAWVSTQGVHGTRERLRARPRAFRRPTSASSPVHGRRLRQQVAGRTPKGIICAKLAKEAKRAGQADARSQGRASRHRQPSVGEREDQGGRRGRRHAHRVRRRELGHGRRGRGVGLPAAVHLHVPEPPARRTRTSTSTPASSAPMRAPGHPQGCFLTEVLMDELADRVKMDPVEFRIKNLPPQAPNAMWRDVPARRRAKRSAGTSGIRPATRRPGRSRPAWAARRTGGAAAAAARRRTARSSPDGSVVMKCGTQDIGTGTRTIVAMVAAETLGLPVSAVTAEIGDTNLSASAAASGGSTTAASVIAGDSRRRPARRSTRSSRRSRRRSASTPTTLVAANGRIHVKDNAVEGHDVEGRLQAARHRADLGRRRVGSRASSVDGTSGVQFAEVDGGHRDRHRQGEAHPGDSGLRARRRQAHRREPGATAASSAR